MISKFSHKLLWIDFIILSSVLNSSFCFRGNLPDGLPQNLVLLIYLFVFLLHCSFFNFKYMFQFNVITHNLLVVKLFLVQILQCVMILFIYNHIRISLLIFKHTLVILQTFHNIFIVLSFFIYFSPQNFYLFSSFVYFIIWHINSSKYVWFFGLFERQSGLNGFAVGFGYGSHWIWAACYTLSFCS